MGVIDCRIWQTVHNRQTEALLGLHQNPYPGPEGTTDGHMHAIQPLDLYLARPGDAVAQMWRQWRHTDPVASGFSGHPLMRTWLMLLGLVLLQGCSAIKLGYQQLPTLSYWWLDSTVSFNATQTAATKQALEHIHQWHRSEELPAYADLLQRVQTLSAGPVQTEQVCRVWADVQIRLDVLMREAVVQAAPVAMALGPRQLSHMARRWEIQNEDWEKEWLQGSASERLERRLDKTLERYRSFYGELTPAQIGLVKAQLAQSPWSAEWGRQDRQRRQQDLLSTLHGISQNKLSQTETETQLWGVWQRWLKPPEAGQRAVVQSLSQRACENLAQLHNSASSEQRQQVMRRLRAYERDIKDLVKSRP